MPTKIISCFTLGMCVIGPPYTSSTLYIYHNLKST